MEHLSDEDGSQSWFYNYGMEDERKCLTDKEKYQLLYYRHPQAEGRFVQANVKTSIVCRPSCRSQLAPAENLKFYDDFSQAMQHSFKPCKRCKPEVTLDWQKGRGKEFVTEACKIIAVAAGRGHRLDIDGIMEQLVVTKSHLYWNFKIHLQMSPEQVYLKYLSDFGAEIDKKKAIRSTRGHKREKKSEKKLLAEKEQLLQRLENEFLILK